MMPLFSWSYLRALVILAVVYFVSGWFGTLLSYSPDSITLIWPPAGIALAAGYLFGYQLWPGVLLGEAAVLLANRIPVAVTCSVSIGNALAMVTGVWLLKWRNFDRRLQRVRDVLALAVLAGLLGTTVSASIGVSAMTLGGVLSWPASISTWLKWWLGDTMGVLLVAPLLLTWSTPELYQRRSLVKAVVAFLVLGLTSGISFGGWLGPQYANLPVVFLPLACLVWIALNLDIRGVSVAILSISVITVAGTALGFGPFVRPNVPESLALLWSFLAVAGLTTLLLSAALAEQRKLQGVWREHKHFVSAVLNSVKARIAVLDHEGKILGVNRAWQQFAIDNGVPRESVGVGTNYLEVCRRGMGGAMARDCREGLQAILDGQASEFEQEYACNTGTGEHWFSMQAVPLLRQEGGLVVSHIEITKLKQMERALRESEERYRTLFENAREAVITSDAEGKVIAANPAAAVLVGFRKPEEMIGKSALSLFVDQAQRQTVFMELIKNGYAENFEVALVKQGNGAPVHVLGSATLQRNERGEIQRIEGILTDVTKLKQAADELRQAKEAAEHANLAKTRFLATVGHDLRQPLQSITLLNAVLLKRPKDGEVREIAQQIREALGVMEGLLGVLLDISKLEAGVIIPEKRDFPVADLLDRMGTAFGPQAAEAGVDLRIVPCSALIHSDATLLERIVQNFLANALQHAQASKVLVGCRRQGRQLGIEVWDNGIGIPETQQRAIFQEFCQLDNPPRDQRKGWGLGLTIVERMAHLLDHAIAVRSTPGKGSVFAVSVARAEVKPSAREVPRSPLGLNGNPAAALILLIDDEPAIVKSLQMLLEISGLRVITALTAKEALDQLADGKVRPDLIISDYRLPDSETGIQLIQSIRNIAGQALPAILLTGDTSPEQVLKTRGAGCEVLYKPVDGERLIACIRGLLKEDAEYRITA